MNDTLEKLKQNMKSSKGIPALEGTANEVLQMIQGSNPQGNHVSELATLITNDVALTQRILKLVNSPMYMPFSNGTKSVTDALRILGLRAVVHLILSAMIIEDDDATKDEELSRALIASEFAKCVADPSVEEDSAIAALLYNMGRMLTKRYLPEESARIERLLAKGYTEMAASDAVLRITYRDLGEEVARWWHLPIDIITVLNGTGDKDIIGIAEFSTSAAAMVRSGIPEKVNTLLDKLNLSEEVLSRVVELIRVKVAERANEPPPEPVSPPTPDYADMTPSEGMRSLTIETRKCVSALFDLDKHFLNHLMTVTKAAHCLLMCPSSTGAYVMAHGVGSNLTNIGKIFELTSRGRTTVTQAMLANNVDVVVLDFAKFNTRSLPDVFKEVFPDARMLAMLPVVVEDHIKSILFLDWDKPYALGHNDVNGLKRLRTDCSEYLYHRKIG